MRFRSRHLFLADLVAIMAAAVAAFVVRYEALLRIGPYIARNWFFFLSLLVTRPVLYYAFGLYRRYWRYASIPELLSIVQAVTVGSLIVAVLTLGFLAPFQDGVRVFSRSILLLEWILNLLFIGGLRFLLRLGQSRDRSWATGAKQRGPVRTTLIMGAGDAGALVVREMLNNRALGYVPVGFVDDDRSKNGARIYGIQVLGTRQDIPRLVRKLGVDEVVIAMPSAPGAAVRDVRSICQTCRVKAKTVPGLYELLSGAVRISQIREVRIEDLLRREPVVTDLTAADSYLAGATVMVTGAGGSIGSELCRQVAARRPDKLLALGHGENSIYNIVMELHDAWPRVEIIPLIADVRDADRMERLLLAHHPQVVFHAAAHKHVPLMESNPEEAFTTNVLGTMNVLRAAEVAGVESLVLISSDKAVNPANIMGASKYLAELLVQRAARRLRRRYVAVRFGNVLGSRGSAVPLFEKQIAAGGPVTITHPDMKRYFMTIPEAVQLILHAVTLGEDGGIFVLDMGEQIRILDLAHDLILLSGLTPGEDIAIEFTGMRAGEKLYEELFGEGETRMATGHSKIFRTEPPMPMSEEELQAGITAVLHAAQQANAAALTAALSSIVPTYRPADHQAARVLDRVSGTPSVTVPDEATLAPATHSPA